MSGANPVEDAQARAVRVVVSNRYGVLGTVDSDGPWVAALAVFPTESGRLMFMSPAASRHAMAILADPRVSLVMFDSHLTGAEVESLQISGNVEVLNLTIASAMEFARAVKPRLGVASMAKEAAEMVKNRSDYAIFRLTITDSYVLDQAAYRKNGFDARQPVDGEAAVSKATFILLERKASENAV
jgi:nitroimidazol reductase NimA-like FMN-containing flavoprotein (pyridoxamine 5'-phosphate oxidase superfamily)